MTIHLIQFPSRILFRVYCSANSYGVASVGGNDAVFDFLRELSTLAGSNAEAMVCVNALTA